MARKLVIGIMGGIASGKSTLAGVFAELGATIVDADVIGHQVLERPEVKERVRIVWGDSVFSADGSIERSRLGAEVFSNPEAMSKLSSIVHPLILETLSEEVRESDSTVVLDAALLDEFSLTAICDHLVFVESPTELREQRALDERGWAPGEIEKRESFQNPLSAKRSKANYVIRNRGDRAALREQARQLWHSLGLDDDSSQG